MDIFAVAVKSLRGLAAATTTTAGRGSQASGALIRGQAAVGLR
jgi:hypothetical protein